MSFSEDATQLKNISGVNPNITSHIADMESVGLTIKVDGQQIEFFVKVLLYVSGTEYGLLSPGFADTQGLEFEFDITMRCFAVFQHGKVAAMAILHGAM